MPIVAMTLVPRRPRAALLVLLIAVVAATGILAPPRSSPRTLRAQAMAPSNLVTDLTRPPWFALRLLADRISFRPLAPPPLAPTVRALAGILVDIDAHTILWQRAAHSPLPPASTTKVLSALVALENFPVTRRVTVTAPALDQSPDESRMGLRAGETLTVDELLTGMLLVSGNDAATAMAVDTVGLERFVAAMNAQMAAAGLHDSHFSNPVGLSDAGLYASAYDLAAISALAVRNFPRFRDIVAMRTAELPATVDHPAFSLQSINQLLATYPPAVGIKPGWTSDAGYCEIAMAVREGHHLISVLLNAPYPYAQTRRLLDWGFIQLGLASTLPTPTPTPVPSPHA